MFAWLRAEADQTIVHVLLTGVQTQLGYSNPRCSGDLITFSLRNLWAHSVRRRLVQAVGQGVE